MRDHDHIARTGRPCTIDALLPLDQAAHHALAIAVLNLPGDRLEEADYRQIVLQLDDHALVLAVEARARRAARACPSPVGERVEDMVADMLRSKQHPARPGTLADARNSARAVVALHTYLGHLANAPSVPYITAVEGAIPGTGAAAGC
ncbi:hypothetical protein ACGFYF_41835 [Streptomyces lavendulae]|uniref:hypothetical protein n=1 Tax=Streptomyces lavendulae TaxID=1914 RepID=UPI003717D655